jgi:hypothetical protein
MKYSERRKGLKDLRDSGQLSVALAAMWAWVDQRTWRSWETDDDNSSARDPSPAAFWSFLARSGVGMERINTPGIGNPLARVIAIARFVGPAQSTSLSHIERFDAEICGISNALDMTRIRVSRPCRGCVEA